MQSPSVIGYAAHTVTPASHLTPFFIGIAATLVTQWLLARVAHVRTAQRLAVSFAEELSGVHFYPPEDRPNVVGFTSQTFDTLFREAATSLPETLFRDLMRYHRLLRQIEELKPSTMPDRWSVIPRMWTEARALHSDLRPRLIAYSARTAVSVFIHPGERDAKSYAGD